ncbi:MAG: hypothetical protein DRO99_01260 [Candidatus Aenigmatarchaeota archaeon]|nr:MAG: hypothetical protein DRO99_01260 [Candidatus Aenigmarchaeota archaeon]
MAKEKLQGYYIELWYDGIRRWRIYDEQGRVGVWYPDSCNWYCAECNFAGRAYSLKEAVRQLDQHRRVDH